MIPYNEIEVKIIPLDAMSLIHQNTSYEYWLNPLVVRCNDEKKQMVACIYSDWACGKLKDIMTTH